MNSRIIEDWRHEQISMNGPASEFDMAECEAALNFRFPDDFKHFYFICNGFADCQMDSRLLSLWPLQRMRIENVKPGFIAFADYNASGSLIGYMPDRSGIYHNYNSEKFCNTFNEFIGHWKSSSGEYI